MEVSLTDKFGDIVKKTVDSKNHHKNDLYVMCEGKILRRSEELKSCEGRDGCTVHVVSRLRGGGKHKDNKGKVEKKQVTAHLVTRPTYSRWAQACLHKSTSVTRAHATS